MEQENNSEDIDTVDSDDMGGGNPSYKGYVYQKRVTAWVALSLLLERPSEPTEIIVEPASDEDIEADLKVQSDLSNPMIVVPGVHKLTIQIKFRGKGHWSNDAFAKLVTDKEKTSKKGPTPRPRAKSLLVSDPTRRYILITNTSVDSGLSDGRIHKIDEKPKNSFLPPKLNTTPDEKKLLMGRFGFIECLSFEVLDAKIRTIIETIGHVPSTHVLDVREKIELEIEDRLRGLPAPLTRNQVFSIIENFGGLPNRDRELNEYIEPSVAIDAAKILSKFHAILLVGPPGFGKSLIAKNLVYQYRLNEHPFSVIRETQGLTGIEILLNAPGRHVFYLDDPWGQSKLENNSSDWVVKLPDLINRATPDKIFIITTRTDIFTLATVGINDSLWSRIKCLVTEINYDNAMRWDILQRKLQNAESWQKDFATQYRYELVSNLTSPLALERLARILQESVNLESINLHNLIEQAQVDSIVRIVSQKILGWSNDAIPCATILWAMIRRNASISVDRLSEIRRELERVSNPLIIDLERFVQHFSAETLKVEDNGKLTAHGKVIEAFENVIVNHFGELERTLERTAEGFLLLYENDKSYINELIRLINAVNSLSQHKIKLSVNVRSKIDKILVFRLSANIWADFSKAYDDILTGASDQEPIANLVRFLELGAPKSKSKTSAGLGFSNLGWHPPKISESELLKLKAEPLTEHVLMMWISFILPNATNDYDADNLITWLKQFPFDFAQAFLTACKFSSEQPHFHINTDTVFEGAIRMGSNPFNVFADIETLERILNAEHNRNIDKECNPWQGEFDFSEQIHLQDSFEENGSIVEYAVKGFIRGRRSNEGYKWISEHDRLDLILPAWGYAMLYSKQKVTIDELDAFFSLAATTELRCLGFRIIGQRKINKARDRILESFRSGMRKEREEAVTAFDMITNEKSVENELIKAMNEVDIVGQLELFLAGAKLYYKKKDRINWMQKFNRFAPDSARELFTFILLYEEKVDEDKLVTAFLKLSPQIANTIITRGPKPINSIFLRISANLTKNIESSVVDDFLLSDDIADVCAAIDVISIMGGLRNHKLFNEILGHSEYEVRCYALKAFAQLPDNQSRKIIYEFAKDRSAPVREELAKLIGENRWEDGVDILLELLSDTRDYNPHPEYDQWSEPRYEVARTAANSLSMLSPLADENLVRLISFVDLGSGASTDIDLHIQLIRILASYDDLRIAKLLSKCLDDNRCIGYKGEMLFPVRYASGWSLFWLLAANPEYFEEIDWSSVELGAASTDPQLAAPCLCLIGRTLENPRPETLTLLRSAKTSQVRRILSLFILESLQLAQDVSAKYNFLDFDHPLLASENKFNITPITSWPLSSLAIDWLKSLDSTEDVNGVLLKIAACQTKLDFGVDDFDMGTLRRKKRIPVMTFHEMFGMQ